MFSVSLMYYYYNITPSVMYITEIQTCKKKKIYYKKIKKRTIKKERKTPTKPPEKKQAKNK